jgi:hypothetical protein
MLTLNGYYGVLMMMKGRIILLAMKTAFPAKEERNV